MIVVQQGKTRKHWADLFEWMIEEQGMFPIEEPDRSIVLDYLAENYNEDRPNFPTP
jgi:cytochrome c